MEGRGGVCEWVGGVGRGECTSSCGGGDGGGKEEGVCVGGLTFLA